MKTIVACLGLVSLLLFNQGVLLAKTTDTVQKKIVMIVAQQGFRDEELLTPLEMFRANGFGVTVASSSLDLAVGMLGTKIVPDVLFYDVDVKNYDAVVFVGGAGASVFWNDPSALQIAKQACADGKIVAAICIAPVTLANAGILKGKKATCWSTNNQDIMKGGATYTGKAVQIDGMIVTANGPEAAKMFAEEVIKLLNRQ
ncbi:MAG TPA: DJ-1/PfpI family protein [bacterium]|nr:DJ-1/PfpI family protein [bacterium]